MGAPVSPTTQKHAVSENWIHFSIRWGGLGKALATYPGKVHARKIHGQFHVN